MKRVLLLVLLAVSVRTAVAQQGSLYWANGDALPGQLVKIDQERLTWKSPLFVQPLVIRANHISRVAFTPPISKPKGIWRIAMHGGDTLFGDVKQVQNGKLSVKSKRHGDVVIDLSAVQSIRRMNNPALVYHGPNNLNGWSTYEGSDESEMWKATAKGYLQTNTKDAQLFRALPKTSRIAVEIELSVVQTPISFQLAFCDQPKQSPRLEVWDNELVAAYADDFEPIITFKATDRVLAVQVFWDEKSGVFAVFDSAGKKLGSIKAERPAGAKFGVYLRNQGADLSFRKIHISKWNGTQPKPVKVGQTRVHMLNGEIEYGRIVAAQGGRLNVRIQQQTKQVPLANVERMVFASKVASAGTGGSMSRLSFSDGGQVSGKLLKVASGAAVIKPSYSESPISSELTQAIALSFVPKSRPFAGAAPFRFFCENGNLRGNLVGGTAGSSAVHWMPVGGISAVAIAPKCQARIVRMAKTSAKMREPEKYPDRIYLINKEMIPCRIREVTEKSVHLSTPYSTTTQIATNEVKAIEFATQRERRKAGLAEAGWQVVRGRKVVLPKAGVNQVTLRPGQAVGHRTMITGDQIHFRLKLGQGRLRYGSTTVRFGGSDWKRRESAPGLRFYLQRNRVSVSAVRNGGNRFATTRRSTVSGSNNGVADIVITLQENRISVKVNGRVCYAARFNLREFTGRSLIFSNMGYPTPQNGSDMIVSNLKVVGEPLQGRFIQPEAKAAALTTPRFRRDNPPEHILVAPNADLLRGRLRSVTEGHVLFQSRLEDFRFTRKQVAAVIWLHPRRKAAKVARDESRPWVRALLTEGQIVNVQPTQMTSTQLIGNSTVLKKCQLDFNAITELHVGGYGSVDEQALYADWIPRSAPEPNFPGGDTGSTGGDTSGPLVGTTPDDFQLERLQGGKFRLSEQKGKIIVLDFWATWCAPCIRAMPKYVDVTSKYDKNLVQFVAVNQAEKAKQVKQFLARKGWKFSVVMDANKGVAGNFGVRGIPHTVVIGTDGKIKWAKVGYRNGEEQKLKKILDELVGKAKGKKTT